jgi:hypothetical protein
MCAGFTGCQPEILHHCNVVVTDGESYRMRDARYRGGSRTKNN